MDPTSYYIFICATALVSTYFIYKWLAKNHKYFEHRKVPALKPILLFGNSAHFFTKKVDLIDFVKKLYHDFPNEK